MYRRRVVTRLIIVLTSTLFLVFVSPASPAMARCGQLSYQDGGSSDGDCSPVPAVIGSAVVGTFALVLVIGIAVAKYMRGKTSADDFAALIQSPASPVAGRLLRTGDKDGPLRQGIDDEGLMWNKGRLVANVDNVRKVAAKFGIDLEGYEFTIDRGKVSGEAGETARNGKFKLYIPAFDDDIELARTLVHEIFHVDELRRGIPFPTRGQDTSPWEQRATAHEKIWFKNHPLNPLNQGRE